MDNKQKLPIYARNQSGNGFYEVAFSALLWSVVPPTRFGVFARFDYLHCLFCKIGVNSVNMVAFTLFTPFTPNVSVNGVNIENRVDHN